MVRAGDWRDAAPEKSENKWAQKLEDLEQRVEKQLAPRPLTYDLPTTCYLLPATYDLLPTSHRPGIGRLARLQSILPRPPPVLALFIRFYASPQSACQNRYAHLPRFLDISSVCDCRDRWSKAVAGPEAVQ